MKIGPFTLDAPEGLLFQAMSGSEELGRPFVYTLELVSKQPRLSAADVLGQVMAVQLELPDGATRAFSGVVHRFEFVGTFGPLHHYRATLGPWLWLLTRTSNCRIFQHKTVPDIVTSVFREHGFTDFEEALSADYKERQFVVQYCETDFDFVSRLLEHEGIYYFFKHQGNKHTLVLADSYGAHQAAPGYEEVPYFPPDPNRSFGVEHLDQWQLSSTLESGAYALNDFNFERPRASLLVRAAAPSTHPHSASELYQYPGRYLQSGEGETYARIRLEERQALCELAQARGNARGLGVGSLFKLTEHEHDEQNREYLIVQAQYRLRAPDQEAIRSESLEPAFRCELAAIKSERPFRPRLTTTKPMIRGPQTAIVVGQKGEEIWTDDYGRVKVRFHWNRTDPADENSSCWVRVAQIWAGSNWGGLHIPRIGQEVVVDFLEGDPDQPLITGSVYNADQRPPYELPQNQTQSGIKSRSSKEGGANNFNELRFEDKKGSEHVFLHAEKDLQVLVKNAESTSVGATRGVSVGADDSLSVGGDRGAEVTGNDSLVVKQSRTATISSDESLSVGGNRDAKVAGSDSLLVGGSSTKLVSGSEATTIVAARNLTAASESIEVGARTKVVATTESTSVGGGRSETVGGAESVSISGSRTHAVQQDESLSIGGKRSQTVSKDDALKVGKNLVIDAGDELVLKCGSSTLTLKKNGDIILKGKDIKIDGSGKINVKASSNVVVKGSNVAQN